MDHVQDPVGDRICGAWFVSMKGHLRLPPAGNWFRCNPQPRLQTAATKRPRPNYSGLGLVRSENFRCAQTVMPKHAVRRVPITGTLILSKPPKGSPKWRNGQWLKVLYAS